MKALLPFVFTAFIAGCSTSPDVADTSGQLSGDEIPALGNVEYHTSELASELLSRIRVDRTSRIAVATFVPVTTLKSNLTEQDPLMLLGHQLEQGLITELSRRGWIAQDYKLTPDILLSGDSERVFSRSIEELAGSQPAEYFLSGTIVRQEAGAIVNARLVHVQSRDVIAAATKFFPAGLFWQEEQVTSRNGLLYRKAQ